MTTFKLQVKVKFGIAYKAKIIVYRLAWPVIKIFSNDSCTARNYLISSLMKSVSFEHDLIKSKD